MTKDEAFQQYEEELDRIGKQYTETLEKARVTLKEQLKTIREASYIEDLHKPSS